MKKVICGILLVIFLAVFCVTGYKLLSYYKESKEQKAQYSGLEQLMEQAREEAVQAQTPEQETTGPDGALQETVNKADIPVPALDKETGETVMVLPEFKPLYELNPDIVGWIKVPGTNISYPVMQSETPNYYLYVSFYDEYSNHGTIYAKEECDVFTPSDNITIYGHHMNDDSMFHALDGYVEQDFWEEHKTFSFNTIFERHDYEVIAVFPTSANLNQGFPYHRFIDAQDQAEFDEFVAKCKELAYYDTGLTAEYGDKLVCLSTCEYTLDNGRLVVVGRRIN